jgi:hypothetical protein
MLHQLRSMKPESKVTVVSERPPFVGEEVPTFVDRGQSVVRVADPYGRNLGFLDRSRYFFSPISSSVVLTRLSGPCFGPTTSQKIRQRRESIPDL